MNDLQPVKTSVHLPKFTFDFEQKLKEPLIDLGMEIAFSSTSAAFTGINPGGRLRISEVKQKTHITVDEKGTEAAAATSVGIGLTSAGIPTFNANRPFLFMITERSSGLIVFMGKLSLPAKAG